MTIQAEAEEKQHRLNQVSVKFGTTDSKAHRLRALAAQLVSAEQKERRRLAQILHDHLQQLLVGAKFGVSIIRVKIKENDLRQTADQLAQTLDEAIRASRSLSAERSNRISVSSGRQATVKRQWIWRGNSNRTWS
jgi:signal transduction histidine kinase